MFAHILIGSLGNVVTIFIMSAFLAMAIRGLAWAGKRIEKSTFGQTTLTLAIVTLWLLAGISTATWFWAGVLILLGIFQALEPALYFTVVTLTTVGYGDLVLDDNWRILSGFIAANGLVLFGLLTAFTFKVLMQLSELGPDGAVAFNRYQR